MVKLGAPAGNSSVFRTAAMLALFIVCFEPPGMITSSPTTGTAPVDQLSMLLQFAVLPLPVQVSVASALKLSSVMNRRANTNRRRQDVAEVSDWAVDFVSDFHPPTRRRYRASWNSTL